MFVSLVLFSVAICLGNVTGKNITSNFYREEPCSEAGGFCVLKNECYGSVDESKNLCPRQKHEGAVCCKGFQQEDANCYQLHNACMDSCPEHLGLGRRGCSEGKICCVLIF